MKNDFRQQEILLVIGSTFSCREWLHKDEKAENRPLSKRDKLKLACWDGLVPQMLPECFENRFDKSLHLWEMNEANAFIDLEYGEAVPAIEKSSSLNPYVFLSVQEFN